MPLGIGFWVDFGGFWMPKWSLLGTKMGSKIDVTMVFEIQWVVVGSKTSIENRSKNGVQDGMHLDIEF